MKKKQIIKCSISVIFIILLFIALFMDPTSLIITMGIGPARILKWALTGLFAVGFLFNTIVMIRMLLKERKREEPTTKLYAARAEKYDEDAIKAEVERFLKIRPNLQTELKQACDQMDSINRKQAKIREILTRNKMDIQEVEDTIAIAEKSLLHNVVKIINRADLWDTEECNRAEKAEIYREHREQIQNRLKQNEEILINCDVLLSATMDYIENKNKDDSSGQLHLESMTDAIRKLTH